MTFDLNRFLELHAQFMSAEDPFEDSKLCQELSDLLTLVGDPRDIKNPNNKDGITYGYVAVRSAWKISIVTRDIIGQIDQGEVLIMQFERNKNINITEWPIDEKIPIPFLLNGNGVFRGIEGVWLPIFDSSRIRDFAERRIKKMRESFEQFLSEQEQYWSSQTKAPQ